MGLMRDSRWCVQADEDQLRLSLDEEKALDGAGAWWAAWVRDATQHDVRDRASLAELETRLGQPCCPGEPALP